MVRLRETGVDRGLYFDREFQFQYGAIKRFNPNTVWSRLYIFQFQYGAIKRTIAGMAFDHQKYFNSSMVRLREAKKARHAQKHLAFQFQYGAIKSFEDYLHIHDLD